MTKLFLITLILFSISSFSNIDYSFETTLETRKFKDDGLSKTDDEGLSLFVRGSSKYQLNDLSIRLGVISRVGLKDKDRSYFGFDDTNISYLFGSERSFSLLAGFKVFNWTAMEAFHPADILNSRNLDSNLENTEKLGELVLEFEKSFNSGSFSLFYLPRFTKPIYPGMHSRLRFPPTEDIDIVVKPVKVVKDHKIDDGGFEPQFGTKINYTVNSSDFSFFFVRHIDRSQPILGFYKENQNYSVPDNANLVSLSGFNVTSINSTPYYFYVNKLGATYEQAAFGNIFKAEFIYKNFSDNNIKILVLSEDLLSQVKTASPQDHSELALGFERLFTYENSDHETTLYFELTSILGPGKESRSALGVLQRDAFVGFRHVFNDINDKQITFGWIHDLERAREDLLTLTYQQRLGNSWRFQTGARLFLAQKKESVLQGLEVFGKADHIYLNISRFF